MRMPNCLGGAHGSGRRRFYGRGMIHWIFFFIYLPEILLTAALNKILGFSLSLLVLKMSDFTSVIKKPPKYPTAATLPAYTFVM